MTTKEKSFCPHGKRFDQFCISGVCHRGRLVPSEGFAQRLLKYFEREGHMIATHVQPMMWACESLTEGYELESIKSTIDWSEPLMQFAFSEESIRSHQKSGYEVVRWGYIILYVPFRTPTFEEMKAYHDAEKHFRGGFRAAGGTIFEEKDPGWDAPLEKRI